MTKYMEKIDTSIAGIIWLDSYKETDRFFADFGSLYVAAYKQHFLAKRQHTFEGMFSGLRKYSEALENLVDRFLEFYPGLRLIDVSYTIPEKGSDKEPTLQNAVMLNDDHIVVVSGGDYVYMYTVDPMFLRENLVYLNENFGQEVQPASVNIIVQEMGQLQLKNIPLQDRPLVEENYMPECVEDLHKVTEAVTTPRPFGRLSILAGVPGTGKTSYLKSLLSIDTAKFLTVPSTYVNALEESGIVKLVLDQKESGKPLVILLEDADGALEARNGSAGDSRVCALLSALDGVLSEVMDIRVVATTNLPIDKLDDALLRPGRLAHLVHVPTLSVEQAQKILDRLNKDLNNEVAGILPNKKDITLADVYAAAHGTDSKADENRQKIAPRRTVGF